MGGRCRATCRSLPMLLKSTSKLLPRPVPVAVAPQWDLCKTSLYDQDKKCSYKTHSMKHIECVDKKNRLIKRIYNQHHFFVRNITCRCKSCFIQNCDQH